MKNIASDVDIIISCGDLPAYYLDFLVTVLGKPMYYVCGNHDHYDNDKVKTADFHTPNTFSASKYDYNSSCSFGGNNLDGKIYNAKGVLICGMEGSFLYNYGEHQYSEKQMKRKIRKISPVLLFNRIFNKRYIDILVTHAPPHGIHDKEDLPHRGFNSYLFFIEKYRPKYLLHGHIHLYDRNKPRVSEYKGTKVINCYDYQILDLDV